MKVFGGSTQINPTMRFPPEEWRWKLLIRQPEFVTSEIVEKARQEIVKKKKAEPVNEVKFEQLKEGKCAQILYIGPHILPSQNPWQRCMS